ncbi:hypothetical protein GCM10022222_81540 [Amycolatopsis ultiminotia]|uniref:Excreted virulence factor EspC, type VII ESX diderm n=1 Tax=Amycolatopsis ultiminotia TaxID=543629 RepID=A0ABP6YLZ6_9PSEU
MTGGFGTVPEELTDAANHIGDVVGRVGELPWPGPSGDYGHPGVQQGWRSFIEDTESVVDGLIEQAREHGEALRRAASWYLLGDEQAEGEIGKAGAGVLDPLGSGGATKIGAGVLNPLGSAGEAKIGAGLNGVPGGGFTGGLTPAQLDERLGRQADPDGGWSGEATGRISGSIDDGPAGVMSPQRSRELFPGASAEAGEPGAEGPVF